MNIYNDRAPLKIKDIYLFQNAKITVIFRLCTNTTRFQILQTNTREARKGFCLTIIIVMSYLSLPLAGVMSAVAHAG